MNPSLDFQSLKFSPRLGFLFFVLTFVACKVEERPTVRRLAPDLPQHHETHSIDNEISLEDYAFLNRTAQSDWQAERNDRRELVLPAPENFRPVEGKRAQLRLILKDGRLRRSELPQIRLELQNVGSEPYFFFEKPSFFKEEGQFDQGRFKFHLTGPDGHKRALAPLVKLVNSGFDEISIPPDLLREKDSDSLVQELNSFAAARKNLSVRLLPGETLYSRQRRDLDLIREFRLTRGGAIPPNPAPLGFRPLRFEGGFTQAGLHLLEVSWEPAASEPVSEQIIDRLVAKGWSRDKALAAAKRLRQAKAAPLRASVELEVVE